MYIHFDISIKEIIKKCNARFHQRKNLYKTELLRYHKPKNKNTEIVLKKIFKKIRKAKIVTD